MIYNRKKISKRLFLGLTAILLILTSCDKEAQFPTQVNTVDYYYSYGNIKVASNSSIPSNDGAFLVCGPVGIGGETMVGLKKLDDKANLIWEVALVDDYIAKLYGVAQGEDNSIYVCGMIVDQPTSNMLNIIVFKLNENGDEIWTKKIIIENSVSYLREEGRNIIVTSDGNIVIATLSQNNTPYVSEFGLVKLDPSGNILWKFIGVDKEYKSMQSLIETKDGGYLLTMNKGIEAGNYPKNRLFLIKYDQNGQKLWERYFENGPVYQGMDVMEEADGTLLVCGGQNNEGVGRAFVLKLDALGNSIWEKSYGEEANPIGFSIQKSADGNYTIVGGTAWVPYYTGSDVYILKIDALGNEIWSKTIKSKWNTIGIHHFWDQNKQGVIIGNQAADMFVLQVDENGNFK